MKRNFVAFVLIFILSFVAFSQQNPQFRFYFNGNDVTSVVPVFGNSIFLIGSREAGLGVYNFDSLKYIGLIQKIYVPIPSHNIRALRKYSNDTLWICTDRGLVRLRSNQFVVYNSQNSPLPSDIINDIYVDAVGIWWIATNKGLVMKSDTNWVVFNRLNSGIPDDYVNTVKVDPMGNVWVATPNGLGMYDRTDWYVFNTNNSGLPDNFITFIEFDNFNNSKWVGTLHGGLVHWIGDNFNVYDTSNSMLPSNAVTAFAFDTSHNKWVGTNNGLVLIDQMGWTIFNTTNSGLSDNHINSIFIDALNRKFISTRNKLTLISDTNFFVLSFENSKLPTNYVKKVVEGVDLVKWIVTPEGLVSYDGNNWNVYNNTNSPITHAINDIAVDTDNKLWIATDSGLIVKGGLTNWQTIFPYPNNAPSNRIMRILPSSRGVWVGTDSGLVLFYNGQWFRLDTMYGAKLNGLITSISSKWVEDSLGQYERVYVGLAREGIAVFERDTVRFIDDSNSPLTMIYITDVKENFDGRLYVGTLEQGLFTYDTMWVAHNPITEDFPDFTVLDISFDRNNKPWVTTLAGGIWVSIDDTTYYVITENNYPFFTNNFNSVFVDLSNNKWISTHFGLYVFKQDTIKPELKMKKYDVEICEGNTFTLDFYTFYPFNQNNRFLVQMSDEFGMFDSTTVIGSIQSRNSRTILCYVPKGTRPSSLYKLRIVSTSPEMISVPSGYADRLVIDPLPHPKISGDSIICAKGVIKLWAIREGLGSNLWSFVWNVEGGVLLSPPTDDTVYVRFDTVNTGRVVLTAFTDKGCSDSVAKIINVSTPPGRILNGQARVCSGEAFIYSTTDSSNIYNSWSVINGVLEKKLANNVVVVRWGNQTPGYVVLKRVNQYGCIDSVKLKVDIFPTPNASISGKQEVLVESVEKYITHRIDASVSNKWSVVNGIIIGRDNGDTVEVGWPSGGYGKVKLVQRTLAGCSDSSEKIVRIFERVSMFGDTLVCENSETYYEAISNLGANNQWYVTGGVITSNPQNRRVWVRWNNPGSGTIKLVQTVPGTFFKDSLIKTITIAKIPNKPFIVDSGGYLYSSAPYGNQWYFNGQIMFGDTNRTIVPLRTGYYTVKVQSAPNCESEMSDPFYFVSGVEDELSGLKIYPNPTSGNLFIANYDDLSIESVTIRDLLGIELIRFNRGEIMQRGVIDLSGLTSGTYYVVIKVSGYDITKPITLIK
ncbi:T9SS C-terminal target domain-containing protein [Bacteroidetes/Chlorobi group bacterium Naka2016]|jgi:ligand-binding sensor domain-containing protein|nr:MAG: T9SS C-terminal target domain-containing protein [Bacteroidetes/Chlorobi group bacterium Naka2016]